MTKSRVRITEPGWFLAENGRAVAIQYWDHHFQPYRGAFWRGMVILSTKDRTILDWECLWYTIFGDGFFPDCRGNAGEWDIVRPLRDEEIPADKPYGWMPGKL